MHLIRKIIMLVLIFKSGFTLFGQEPFVCDGDFYVTIAANGNPSQIYSISIDELTGGVNFDALQNPTSNVMNAIGYRFIDNLIYSINPSTFRFYQIDATGVSTQIGTLALNNNLGYYGADITPDGNFMVFIGAGGGAGGFLSRTLEFVDLNDPDYPITQVLNITGGNVVCTDIAFDPLTGDLYGFDSANNRLVSFDVQTGVVNANQFPVTNVVDDVGALFFDAFGNLYAYGNPSNTNFATEFYSINKLTGEVKLEATGPVATEKDGCSCPFTIKLQKTVEPELAFPCTEVIYTFEISNVSGQERTGIDFYDEMPTGLTFLEVVNNPFGGDVSGIGTNEISITDMTVPLGINELQIKVYIEENVEGILKNQAVLSDLPESLGEFTLSDNPKTLQVEDSTVLEVIPLFVELGSDTTQICVGESLILDAGEYNGLTYLWSNGETSSSIEVTQGGQYNVTVNSGCETVFDNTFVFDLDAGVQLPPDITIELGQTVTLTPTIQGFGNITYTWLDPLINSLDCLDCPQPSTQPFFDVQYTLTIETEQGCTAVDSMKIFVEKNRDIYIPNAFSPNGDGINDLFYIFSKGTVKVNALMIFDRWGNLVFESQEGFTNDPNLGWNGKFNGEKMNAAVFVYWAELEYLDGIVEFKKGDVTLVR
jgi:gliding motility-associated-like protein